MPVARDLECLITSTSDLPHAVAMASSRVMEFLAARCRLASKLSSTAVAPVLSGNNTTRNIYATTAKRYTDEYIHAEHMYNLPTMKHCKLKMFIAVFCSLFFGAAIPIWAVRFQLKKQGAGPTLDTKSTTEYPDKLTKKFKTLTPLLPFVE